MFVFSADQPVRTEVWDKQTLTDTGLRLEAGGAPVIAIDLERGRLIGASFTELYVFDIETGELIEQREGSVAPDTAAYFNADKTRLITLDGGANATLWDTETWEHVTDFRADDGTGITSANFASSGELVTADPTGTIVVRHQRPSSQSGRR